MSWWGHTFLPVIQETFENCIWERSPKKAAEIFYRNGHRSVAKTIEKMTPEEWQKASEIAHLFDEDA